MPASHLFLTCALGYANPVLWLYRYREILMLVGKMLLLDGQHHTPVVFVVFSLAHLRRNSVLSLASAQT